MGMPATGKSIDVQLIDIIRFGDDGLVREHWGVIDALAMMQQLGVRAGGRSGRSQSPSGRCRRRSTTGRANTVWARESQPVRRGNVTVPRAACGARRNGPTSSC